MRTWTTAGLGLAAVAVIVCAAPGAGAQQEPAREPAAVASTNGAAADFSDGSEAIDPFEAEFGDAGDDPGAPGEKQGRTLRLGFWVFDFLALDLEPDRTRFRMLDFKIFKLLEIGSGSGFHSFSLVEMPYLLSLAKTTSDGATYEHRLLDFEAVELAIARHRKASPLDWETHFLKVPIVGSAYGRDLRVKEASEDTPEEISERQIVLYVLRNEVDRPEL